MTQSTPEPDSDLTPRIPTAGDAPQPTGGSGDQLGEARAPAVPAPVTGPEAPSSHARTLRSECRFSDLIALDHAEFVARAYQTLLGRDPSPQEHVDSMAQLRRGESRTAVLGQLRYGAEGRARGVRIEGLLPRHIVHSASRAPIIGYVVEWLSSLFRLPVAIRHARLAELRQAEALAAIEARMTAGMDASNAAVKTLSARLTDIERFVNDRSTQFQAAVDRLLPANLAPTLEVRSEPLLPPAPPGTPGEASRRSPDERYVEFERLFYPSGAVVEKQRVYLPYFDSEIAARYPVLDLGCGRGEFMTILRSANIRSIGVDRSASNIERLHRAGLEAHHGDLITFLESDERTYGGAVALQVVEHLEAATLERMLELLWPRLAPGAPLIIESVNPHSPFALGNFHMDPTHIAPIPPDRVRFCMEHSGFGRTLTLFQSPIPATVFGGPELRAHYFDYAVVGYRS